MKFLLKKILLTLLFVSVSLTASNDKPDVSKGDIQFYVDVAQFKENNHEKRIEFSIMIYSDQFESAKDIVEYGADIKIFNADKNIERNWQTESRVVKDEDMIFNSLIINDTWTEIVANGNYKYELKIKDLNSGKEGICEGEIENKNFTSSTISASSIKFFTGHKTDNEKLQLTDNASRQYGLLNPMVYVYYEIYSEPSLFNNYEVVYNINKSTGETIKSFPAKIQEINNEKVKIINALNVTSIPSGVYNLEVEISLPEKEEVLLKLNRAFEVIQFNKKDNSNFENSEVISFFEDIFPYIATETEIENYESLNDEGQLKYIIEFLKREDIDHDPGKNEYLVNLYQKYLYANENFSWGGIEGWKMDRGRILIKYGVPDQIQNYFSEENINPYMVWKYETPRKYEFIFGDLRGDGRFSLIHSNKESEVSNPYWKENLVKAK